MLDHSGCESRSNLMEVKDSRPQGRHREMRSERRARQRRGPMNKNRIFRRECRASGHVTVKPISIKDTKRKSGSRASKAVKLTSGGLSRVPARPGLNASQGALIAWQKSAEGIVVRTTRPNAKGRLSVPHRRNGRADEGPNGRVGQRQRSNRWLNVVANLDSSSLYSRRKQVKLA